MGWEALLMRSYRRRGANFAKAEGTAQRNPIKIPWLDAMASIKALASSRSIKHAAAAEPATDQPHAKWDLNDGDF